MTKAQATKALEAAERALTTAQGRLEAAKAEHASAVAAYTSSRTDEAWDAKESAQRKVERYTLDLEGVTKERNAAVRDLATVEAAEFQTRITDAGKAADLLSMWEPELTEAAKLYERLGELRAAIVGKAQQARSSVAEFDSLVAEARAHASQHRITGPDVPSITRQPPVFTLRFFRETLVRRLGITPDERASLVPPGVGQKAEGHLEHLVSTRGPAVADDLEEWNRREQERSAQQARAFTEAQRREQQARDEAERQARYEEAQARRKRLQADGFNESYLEREQVNPKDYTITGVEH